MENFLRKYGWALALVVISIGSLLLALMTNNLLASQLAPYTVPELPKMAPKPDKKPTTAIQQRRAQTWDRTISQLCLFGCPETEPKNECPGGCPDGQQCQQGQCVPMNAPPAADSDVPVLSDLNMKLMGAMVASNPEYSMALIRDESSNETLVLSPGDLITEGAVLEEIRRDRVILKRNGRFEYIRLDKSIGGDPTTSATPASTVDPTPKIRRRSAPSQPERARLQSGRNSNSGDPVKKVSENEFQVQRAAINRQIKDKKSLARQGRVVPNYSNGKRDGLKLVGISPDSVYSQLGIQSGDVIHSVNGKRVNSSQQAMELFERMKNDNSVSIEIERRGQKKELNYKVR